MSHPIKAAFDVGALAILAGTLSQWLPPIAAAVTIVVGLVRLYESETGKAVLARLRTFMRRD